MERGTDVTLDRAAKDLTRSLVPYKKMLELMAHTYRHTDESVLRVWHTHT